jgi:formylglycine-generating enzyme required for sulfatase activity
MALAHAGPTDVEVLQRRIAELQAQLAAAQHAKVDGSGAAAQGGGVALGERSVQVAGDNTAPINTGTVIETQGGAFIEGAVEVRSGHFIGRDFVQYITQIIQGGEDPEEAKSVIALYLHALVADLAGLRLGEIDVAAQETKREPLQLADVYVALDTTRSIPAGATLAEWLLRDRARLGDEPRESRETRPVSALEALAAHRVLALLGKPGSGKSTFGAHVLLALAQAWQGYSAELERLGETWTHGALLPIRIVLRRFAEQLPPGAQPARAGDLWHFVGRELDASGYGLSGETMNYVRWIARNTGALILLDGLDECGSNAARERVLNAVNEIRRTAGPKCRFVLTTRPYAWPGGPDPEQGVYALADLNDDQIEQFIRGWYQALVNRHWLPSPGEGERKMTDLLDARQRPDLAPLARNPLLLTLMATLHANRGRLPDDRADLYSESVDLLMLRWNRQIGADKALLDELAIATLKLSDLREVLEELAFKVHEEGAAGEGDADANPDGTADIAEDRLVRAFRPLLQGSRDKAAVVVDYIEKRAGLLVGQGEKDGERRFSFPHRTFQEFLAACHLAAKDDFPAECARLARASASHWQVVLPLAARLAKAERGASAADELIGGSSIAEFRNKGSQPDVNDWTCALLAGMQLQEIGLGAIQKRERTSAIQARVADWIAASLPVHPEDGGLPAARRAAAGDVLSALGDPRFDPKRLYLPADGWLSFVHIAADSVFRIGTRKGDAKRVAEIIGNRIGEDEINDALIPTPDYYIARYPVTVAQFRAFVEATGCEPGDPDALRDRDSRPVRYVDWYEALGYCQWLNRMLATAPVLDGCGAAGLVRSGPWQVGLPSESEREKAASGGLQNAIFSWGDTPEPNRANFDESEIGDTSPVGCFPANGFGLHDMIGNLWEWTRSLWGTDWKNPDFAYPYDPKDGKRERLDAGGEVYRVVRGGSWHRPRALARCACRGRLRPEIRGDDLGFRVVLRPPPVS